MDFELFDLHNKMMFALCLHSLIVMPASFLSFLLACPY